MYIDIGCRLVTHLERNLYIAKWQKQMRKGTLEFLVLLCLREQEYYGYSLIQRLKALGDLDVAEGTIYPLLSRLLKEGYIENRWQIMDKGPARKYYKITKKGKEVASTMYESWQFTTKTVVKAWGSSNAK